MHSALSMSLKTNLVFPQDVGPTTIPVNGCLNVRLMTTTELCRVRARLFIASEEEKQWWKIRHIPPMVEFFHLFLITVYANATQSVSVQQFSFATRKY